MDGHAQKKILAIHTGGTISMIEGDNGFVNKPKALKETLEKLPMFNYIDRREPTDFLHLPPSHRNQHDVKYTVEEFDHLLDSSNMESADWVEIGKAIQNNYENYDGFVILHGTDTMVYTASALSFMCVNLKKPIVVTGSQIPIYEPRNDGIMNLMASLMVAGNCGIPEVMICFNNKVFRGNRCVKVDCNGFSAFDSPNFRPLVTLDTAIRVDEEAVRTRTGGEFTVFTGMSSDVSIIRLYPGISREIVEASLRPPVKGVVLETFGAGNFPSNRPDLLKALGSAVKKDVLIVSVTQCNAGSVSSDYEAGRALTDIGVIPCGDMTPQAALTKLSYILGKISKDDKIAQISRDDKKNVMTSSIRGEITSNTKLLPSFAQLHI